MLDDSSPAGLPWSRARRRPAPVGLRHGGGARPRPGLGAVVDRSGATRVQRRRVRSRRHGSAPVADPRTEVLDLGAGGGVPGLVIAAAWPDVAGRCSTSSSVGCDSSPAAVERPRPRASGRGHRRAGGAVRPRPRIIAGALRGGVARGFGSPSATAEMAAPLVRIGGLVLVSEPPGSVGERWPSGPLRELGLVLRRVHPGVPPVVELRQEVPCPSWAPRRIGVPGKRPRF